MIITTFLEKNVNLKTTQRKPIVFNITITNMGKHILEVLIIK